MIVLLKEFASFLICIILVNVDCEAINPSQTLRLLLYCYEICWELNAQSLSNTIWQNTYISTFLSLKGLTHCQRFSCEMNQCQSEINNTSRGNK